MVVMYSSHYIIGCGDGAWDALVTGLTGWLAWVLQKGLLPQLRGDKLKHCPEFLYHRASGFLLLLSSVGFFFFFSFLPSFMSSSAAAE